jgi:plastocyanin
MADTMRFRPAQLRVRQGETVRFVIANKGKLMHEMVLGTEAELREHAELMRKFPSRKHGRKQLCLSCGWLVIVSKQTANPLKEGGDHDSHSVPLQRGTHSFGIISVPGPRI